ncbi:hypothetical protein KQI69_09000 [Eubacterium sp. MSJ-13]|uniref:hypothetical protein n=1 Tax=Eubacterium sp. MSJ-13 TaxID=2841513 RepID=UPI001C129690|nr:hypothetical protein [Eubacterium sp. MSJ-13]MBU5479341.1 hypothetical protein [Eubacterium sp. MSJ-13]
MGTKLDLVKCAPALKNAKFSISKDYGTDVSVNKKGVISIKKKKGYSGGCVIAVLNKKEYRIRVTGF